MKELIPYNSIEQALEDFDNGGRFYNILTKANDDQITSAELAKAAGVFSDKQNMILFLEMALMQLDTEHHNKVISYLSEELKDLYSKHLPAHFTPAEANQQGQASQTAIITGIPKLIDSKTKFTGFIMIPIITNNVTTFAMIPIMDQYDVYELRDEETDTDFFIAHKRGSEKIAEKTTHCAGIIKELKAKKKEESDSGTFLEIIYYSDAKS
tara:strand:+ start:158 stop:790 length:633 start_codon:yes stop_codon:yes gene_type:complete